MNKNQKISPQFLNINCGEGLTDYISSISPEGVDLIVSNKVIDEKILIQIENCKVNGTFICKIDNDTNIQYLYAISLYFKTITLFKPFLENLNENYSYLIAKDFQGNGLDIIDYKINVPKSFYLYVQNYYDSLKNLKINLPKTTKYNMYKCKAMLNIF